MRVDDPYAVVKGCVGYYLERLRLEAPAQVFDDESQLASSLLRSVAYGDPLNAHQRMYLFRIASSYIHDLTYQAVSVPPTPPFCDLPERVHLASLQLDNIRTFLGVYDFDFSELERAIEGAKRLQFRWMTGEPIDYELLRLRADLERGRVVRVPALKSLEVHFGPLTWKDSQGPAVPGQIFIRTAQTQAETMLFLFETSKPRPSARAVSVCRIVDRAPQVVHMIEGESLWYFGRDGVVGQTNRTAALFSVWARRTMSCLYVSDLGAEAGVYVQIPPTYESCWAWDGGA